MYFSEKRSLKLLIQNCYNIIEHYKISMPKLAQLLQQATEQNHQQLIQELNEYFETAPEVLQSVKEELRQYLNRISYYIS